MRVLLIEDEPTTAKSIELMLGTEGFNVYTTDLGEEGLDLGKLYDYDIILLDLNLPDMAAAKLREHLPLDLARKIRARRRVGHEELGKAKWCAQSRMPRSNGYEILYAADQRRRKELGTLNFDGRR